jgi:site-specific recombinase XerD
MLNRSWLDLEIRLLINSQCWATPNIAHSKYQKFTGLRDRFVLTMGLSTDVWNGGWKLSMIDQIFTFESTRLRQRAAPLLEERELFLAHIHQRGVERPHLKSIATTLIQIIRLMDLSALRPIEPSEVHDAARRWCEDPYKARGRGKYHKSPTNFATVAMRWFRFADVISPAVTVKSEYDTVLDDFHRHITVDRGFSEHTIRGYSTRARDFLLWVRAKKSTFADIHIGDVDDYLTQCRGRDMRPRTINGIVCALRALFRYAASRGLSSSRIAPRIKSLWVSRYQTKPKGPEWRDVRRFLDHGFGSTPSELRAAAIVSLCAIYALRRCEVTRLRLSDIDWVAETITVRRGKSGKVQQFPLQFEVGEKILNYLRNGRAKCTCRSLFVTIKPPHRPIHPTVTWSMVAKKLRVLGIPSEGCGLHCLRHSCATKLLREGSSLKDIADFLGHTDMSSVSIYAKFDLKTLKELAAFSLASLL